MIFKVMNIENYSIWHEKSFFYCLLHHTGFDLAGQILLLCWLFLDNLSKLLTQTTLLKKNLFLDTTFMYYCITLKKSLVFD